MTVWKGHDVSLPGLIWQCGVQGDGQDDITRRMPDIDPPALPIRCDLVSLLLSLVDQPAHRVLHCCKIADLDPCRVEDDLLATHQGYTRSEPRKYRQTTLGGSRSGDVRPPTL